MCSALAWLSVVLLLYITEQLNPRVGGGGRQGEGCTAMCERELRNLFWRPLSEVSAAIAVTLGGLDKPLETVSVSTTLESLWLSN